MAPKSNREEDKKMNKQMTPTEIEFSQQSSCCGLWFTDAPGCGCSLARTNWRSAMPVKVRFMGLDKFDTLLGPNEAEIDSR
jgi:hypothetical protein